MVFNSVLYIFSLLLVVFLFYLTPQKLKWILLLIASLIFYMVWSPVLLLLMVFVVFVSYAFAVTLHKKEGKSRKSLLIIALLINFGILFVFKYAVFFNDSFMHLFSTLGWSYPIPKFSIILPMGISFYTFQATGYVIDVYRKDTPVEKNFFKLLLFITFFPQLVAGPIERTESLMPQLFSKKKFSLDNMIIGFQYMIFGFFKKVVIADRAASIVNTVYNSPTNFSGLSFVIASIFFAFQLYGDFSGYSDIAKGTAKLFGIDLMDNFKAPYFSKSIQEFWRRWHISLSTWFKDYVYIPLGGSRVSRPRKYLNLFITFLISGLWHGANWTYLFWGMFHGIIQIVEDILRKPVRKILEFLKLNNFFLINIVRGMGTFLIVCFSYIFFRGNSLSDSFYIVKNLFSDISLWTHLPYVFDVINNFGVGIFEFFVCLGSIGILIIIEFFTRRTSVFEAFYKRNVFIQFVFYFIITVLVFSMGVFHDASAFIYFQF